MLITPPQVQVKVEVSFRAGWLPMSTVGAPGAQGAAVAGMQGAGVGTPSAAEVAAITAGFDGAEHMANGRIFFPGA